MKQLNYYKNFYFHHTREGKKNFRILICFSGKRKSGKDFIAFKLLDFLQTKFKSLLKNEIELLVSVVGISYLLKNQFALLNNLDVEKLKSDNLYKEVVRKEMVSYGNKIRVKDPTYFCK